MNLYFSDSSFQIGGQSHPGCPLLVDKTGTVIEVALLFFKYELLGKVGARDIKTWEAYGRHLYDYFGYMEAKHLCWNYIPGEMSGDISPLAHYVRWCDSTVGNKSGYINDKVGTVQRFYRWAQRAGLIDSIPFTHIETVSQHAGGMLAYTSSNGRKRATTNMHLREAEKPLVVLSRSQINLLMRAALNPTHRAMLHLGLNAGLRAEEITSFPMKYVIDCSRLSNKVKSVQVYLDPSEMHTKNDKARTVRVSVSCMNNLWQYREAIRHKLQSLQPVSSNELFLTRDGLPFVADGLVAPLARIGKRVGFHIHPHMLRHTFATHTLASLEDLKRKGRLRSSPIVVLKGFLGHSSITTTSRYLHHLDAIDDTYGTQYQAEIDELALGYLIEQVA